MASAVELIEAKVGLLQGEIDAANSRSASPPPTGGRVSEWAALKQPCNTAHTGPHAHPPAAGAAGLRLRTSG